MSNLNTISLTNGLERINVKSSLSATDDTTSYAHTKGRSVLKSVVPLTGEKHEESNNQTKLWHGKDINILSIKCSIKNAINNCIRDCKKLNFPFFTNCDSNGNKLPDNLSRKIAIGCCDDDDVSDN